MAEGIVGFAIAWHGTVGTASLGAYFLVNKRTDDLYAISDKFDVTIAGMRRSIGNSLSTLLRPVFSSPPIDVVSTDGTYIEKPQNPVESEQYRSAIGTFIANKLDAITDYRIVRDHCEAHSRLHHRILWVLFWVAIWSGVCFSGLRFREAVAPTFAVRYWEYLVVLTLLVSTALICTAFAYEGRRHRQEELARKLRARYGDL